MKFTAAVLAALATAGVEAVKFSPAVGAKLAVPDAAFEKVASLSKQDRKAKAEFSKRLASKAKFRRVADENGDEQDWENQYQDFWNNEMVVEEFGFNIDQYSLKYTGCHVAQGYNEYIAGDENFETVLGTETYVTFRLCPTENCSDESNYKFGCSINYGEYLISLDEYIAALSQYKADRAQNFCGFCETCAAIKGYSEWSEQMKGTLQALTYNAQMAYDNYLANYQAMQEQDAYNQGDNQAEQDDEYFALQYYNYIHNNEGQNQNQYGQSAYYNQYQYQEIDGQQWWAYADKTNHQGYGTSNAFMNMEQGQWYSMNGNTPSYCGAPIENGYYTEDGEFVQDWGYWNKGLGVWQSFDGEQPVMWDENCYGEIPFGWDEVNGQDPQELIACDYEFSTQCSASYQTCMFELHFNFDFDDDEEDVNGDGQVDELDEQKKEFAMANFQDEIMQAKFMDLLQCQVADGYQIQDYDVEQSAYSNQANYATLYQQKKQYQYQMNNCADDENCIAQVEEAMQTDQNYQAWIIESAWELYEKYKAANQAFYVGAFCESDGFNIGLKVFHDEMCLFPNEDLSVATVLGDEDIEGVSLEAVTSQCISCRDENYYRFMNAQQNQEQQEQQEGDEEGEEGQQAYQYQQQQMYEGEDDNGVLPFCSMMYQVAAKCNANLHPEEVYNQDGYYVDGVYYAPEYMQMYQSDQQEYQEKKVCGMVESLNSGTYKEDGSIYLGNMGWLAGNRIQNEISSATSSMSPGLKSLVFLFAIGAAAMGLWVMVLQGAIRRKMAPWQPKDPVDMARQESGIVMGRSRSGPATNPLI